MGNGNSSISRLQLENSLLEQQLARLEKQERMKDQDLTGKFEKEIEQAQK